MKYACRKMRLALALLASLPAPLWQTESAPFGSQETARWNTFTQWMQESGLLSEDVRGEDAFTSKFAGN